MFIHELVHTWQIAHVAIHPELFWDAAQNAVCELTGTNPYVVPSPLPAWSSLNLEQQASVVDQWYRRHTTAIDASSPAALTDEAAIDDSSFRYIAGLLWTRAT